MDERNEEYDESETGRPARPWTIEFDDEGRVLVADIAAINTRLFVAESRPQWIAGPYRPNMDLMEIQLAVCHPEGDMLTPVPLVLVLNRERVRRLQSALDCLQGWSDRPEEPEPWE